MTVTQEYPSLFPLGFDIKKTYYLSGPMSGIDDFNYPYFEKVAKLFRAAGLKIESPHENAWPEDAENMHPAKLWEIMIGKCLVQMNKCEGIILLQGWPSSKGVQRELEFAYRRKWPVYYYHNFIITDMNRG